MGTVEFDDASIKNDDRPYKFMAGMTSRYVILDKNVTYEDTHYDQGHFICTQKAEGHCLWCEHSTEQARSRFANNIFVYNTMPDGSALQGPLSGHLEWIAYDRDVFLYYRQAKQNFGDLREHDIIFICTEGKYQKGDRQVLPQAWWLLNDKFKAWLAAEYQAKSIKNLSAKLGRHIPYAKQPEFWQRRAEANSKKNGGQNPNPNFNGSNAAASAAARAGMGGPASFMNPVMAGGAPSFGGMPSFGGTAVETAPPPVAPGAPTQSTDLFDMGTPAQAPTSTPSVVPAGAPSGGGMADLDSLLADHKPGA